MITVNKAIMTLFGFKEISFLLFVQNVGLGCMLLLIYLSGKYRPQIPWNTFYASIPLCVLYVCYLSTGLEALDRLSVPVYTLLKNSCPVFISVTENVLNTTQHNWQVIISLFIILFGVTVGQDASGSWASQSGLVWMFLHMYFNVFYAVYAREFMARWQPSKLDSMVCSCVVSVPLYSAMLTWFIEWEDGYQQVRALYALHGWSFVLTFGVSACMGAALTYSMFWLCQKTSALTLAVVGSFNKVPIVITSLIVFTGSQLSYRNALGLMIVFAGSLFYARSAFLYPPKPVSSRWTRANVIVILVICMFIAVCLSSLVQDNPMQARQKHAIAQSMKGGQDKDVSTLVVKYPGNVDVPVVDFVTYYLPSLAAVLRMAPDPQRIKLPLRNVPLRVNTPRPVLLLDNMTSPLLHPDLLPYVGSIFAEVLIERRGKPLLRVIRHPNWGGVLKEAGKGNDIDIALTQNSTSYFASWNVLSLTSGVYLSQETSLVLDYIAIDASTAYCTPMHPSEFHLLGTQLCSPHEEYSRPHHVSNVVGLNATELGTATIGVLIPASVHGEHNSAKDITLVRNSLYEWSDAVKSEFRKTGESFVSVPKCRRVLDAQAKWPFGLRPIQGKQAKASKAKSDTNYNRLPQQVRSWRTRLQDGSDVTNGHSSVATCYVGSFEEETGVAEVTSVRRTKSVATHEEIVQHEVLPFFFLMSVISAGIMVGMVLRNVVTRAALG